MKHKHYDMIVAKAANMDLVQMIKIGDEWKNAGLSDKFISFYEDEEYEYFLCLPQHKEACLHWLNGGEVQQSPLDVEQWVMCGVNKGWFIKHSFMLERLTFRIKPKKEKRWIIIRNGHPVRACFDSKDEAEENSMIGDQLIEIEIEVEV